MEPHNSIFAEIEGCALCPTMGAMPHLTLYPLNSRPYSAIWCSFRSPQCVRPATCPNNLNFLFLTISSSVSYFPMCSPTLLCMSTLHGRRGSMRGIMQDVWRQCVKCISRAFLVTFLARRPYIASCAILVNVTTIVSGTTFYYAVFYAKIIEAVDDQY